MRAGPARRRITHVAVTAQLRDTEDQHPCGDGDDQAPELQARPNDPTHHCCRPPWDLECSSRNSTVSSALSVEELAGSPPSGNYGPDCWQIGINSQDMVRGTFGNSRAGEPVECCGREITYRSSGRGSGAPLAQGWEVGEEPVRLDLEERHTLGEAGKAMSTEASQADARRH